MMKTLSGINLEDVTNSSICHTPSSGVSSLAVDVEEQQLYWLSSDSGVESLTISQMEYSSIGCNLNRY